MGIAASESRVFVADDERSIVELVRALLEGEGLSVCPCYDGETALEIIGREDFDLAVLDIMLPGADGLALCRAIRARALPLGPALGRHRLGCLGQRG